MALWSVSRSITDKASLNGNFQPDQPCLSVVCICVFSVRMTEACLDFQQSQQSTLQKKKNDRETENLKPNNLGATSGKIPKAELQVWSRSLHYVHRGWEREPLICFHSQNFIPFCLLYSKQDMTHLDTLVTSLQPLCPALDVTQRTKRSRASRVKGRLSHHIISPGWK